MLKTYLLLDWIVLGIKHWINFQWRFLFGYGWTSKIFLRVLQQNICFTLLKTNKVFILTKLHFSRPIQRSCAFKELGSISSTFYVRIFCTKFWCHKLENCVLGLKFWPQKFCTKNACVYCWWNRLLQMLKAATQKLEHLFFIFFSTLKKLCQLPKSLNIKVNAFSWIKLLIIFHWVSSSTLLHLGRDLGAVCTQTDWLPSQQHNNTTTTTSTTSAATKKNTKEKCYFGECLII